MRCAISLVQDVPEELSTSSSSSSSANDRCLTNLNETHAAKLRLEYQKSIYGTISFFKTKAFTISEESE
jgi:hypothetical protein